MRMRSPTRHVAVRRCRMGRRPYRKAICALRARAPPHARVDARRHAVRVNLHLPAAAVGGRTLARAHRRAAATAAAAGRVTKVLSPQLAHIHAAATQLPLHELSPRARLREIGYAKDRNTGMHIAMRHTCRCPASPDRSIACGAAFGYAYP